MRKSLTQLEWVFPAPTKSGYIEPSSLKKQHLNACKGSQDSSQSQAKKPKWNVEPFPLYTLRHTCLTRWAPHMDPWTLAKLAGHRDMVITKRYIHPADETIRAAIEKARGAICVPTEHAPTDPPPQSRTSIVPIQ